MKAQNKPKKDDVPTQKELEAMMKEAQDLMNNLDPEAKKMMDSLGIKMPSLNNVPKFTDKQIQSSFEEILVPQLDAARIASLPKTLLTNATILSYLSDTHSKVSSQLKPASRAKGEDIYLSVKKDYSSSTAVGNSAVSLWMLGKVEIAFYVMGRVCVDDPNQTDNLNNYASMLSMGGAEQLALPLLDFLNKRFPGNSTILNNIGQAWFGLGDIDKAKTYLDNTIKLAPVHAQANYTKSFIEESHGNKVAAQEAAKRSIKNAYSPKKQDRLKDLGHKLKGNDLTWNQPMPADALGLERFKWPDYPMNVSESEVLEKEWTVFKEILQKEIGGLKAQQEKLEKTMLAAMQKRNQFLMQGGPKGLMVDPFPPLAAKASIKLKYLIDGEDGQLAMSFQKKTEALMNANLQMEEFGKTHAHALEVIRKKYLPEFGEGKANPFGAACADENSAHNAFLSMSNNGLRQAFQDYLSFMRRKLNNETYYYQYVQWPEEFEVTKVTAKINWLTALYSQKVIFHNKSSWCNGVVDEQKPTAFKLAAFDDVHCQYHSQMTSPVGTIKVDCGRMTTTLDLKVIKLGLKQDMDKETFGDQFMTCSVEVGVGVGTGVNVGPLKAEASAGGSIGAEFDRNGMTELILKVSAGGSVGTDIVKDGSMAGVGVGDLSVDVGVTGQISLITGKSSVESTGLLEGVFKK